jgi:GNAT superfamily N-acetyltransferase
MHSPASLRAAGSGDAGRIAELLGDLGYPASAASVLERLQRLQASRAAAFVADVNEQTVGLCTVHLFDVIHEDTAVAMLSVLVVSPLARRTGVGRCLVAKAEAWAHAAGAGRIVVASGLARSDAHAFYEAIGYEHNARRYTKRLTGRAPSIGRETNSSDDESSA